MRIIFYTLLIKQELCLEGLPQMRQFERFRVSTHVVTKKSQDVEWGINCLSRRYGWWQFAQNIQRFLIKPIQPRVTHDDNTYNLSHLLTKFILPSDMDDDNMWTLSTYGQICPVEGYRWYYSLCGQVCKFILTRVMGDDSMLKVSIFSTYNCYEWWQHVKLSHSLTKFINLYRQEL